MSPLLLSTDTLSGYWLDLIFSYAKKSGFDGIDLAIWKVFDSWDVSYVKELSERYDLLVPIIQVSPNVNMREMNKALALGKSLESEIMMINPTKYFNVKTTSFVKSVLKDVQKNHPAFKFGVINASNESYRIVPIPTHKFNNISNIIREEHAYLGLDIANLDTIGFEQLLDNLPKVMPYTQSIYLADRAKWNSNYTHLPLGSGALKIPTFLKKVAKAKYNGYFSVKLDLTKKELADSDNIEVILKQSVSYFHEHFTSD